jgi:hypothetical protein
MGKLVLEHFFFSVKDRPVLEFVWKCQVMHILRACIDASALLLFAVKPSPNPIPKLCMAEDPLYCSSTLSWVQGVPNKPL